MFDRFVRISQARNALRRGDFAQCLRLLDDPELRSHRRVDRLRDEALRAWCRRGSKRAETGDPEAAEADLRAIRAQRGDAGSDHDAVIELAAAIDRARQHRAGLAESLEDWRSRVRSALERGGLALAETELVNGPVSEPSSGDADSVSRVRAELEAAVAERRKRVGAATVSLVEAMERGDAADAGSAFLRLRTLDPESRELASRRPAVVKLCRTLAERGQMSDGLRSALTADPELGAAADWKSIGRGDDAHDDAESVIEDFLAASSLDGEACRFDWGGLESRLRDLPASDPMTEALRGFWRQGHRGRLGPALELLDVVGSEPSTERLREIVRKAEVQQRGRLSRLRDAIGASRCSEAKRTVLERLREWPEHEAYADCLRAIESTEDGWRVRLETLRDMQREGRIGEALLRARELAAVGDFEAPLGSVIDELERRREVVRAGVAEVERRFRVPSARARDEIDRALARLDELSSIQIDSPELTALRESVLAERDGTDHLDAMRRSLESESVDAFVGELSDYRSVRDRLMDSGRLRGLEQSIAESARNRARQSLDRGEVEACLRWLEAADRIPVESGRSSAEALERTARGRRAAADRLIEQARQAWTDGQHDRARSLLDAARDQGADVESVVKFDRSIRAGSAESELLERAEAERQRGDLDAANRTLRSMGATPAALRSRVFDFKRSLAEAQGFGDLFLLRVDDAGEFLVFRGDSVTVGNLREGVADLPMLARLKGVHARLRRSMSFHGGLSDRVQAEGGDLFDSDGVATDRIDLAGPVSFRLGDSVRFDYCRPSERSLSATLRVGGGFRVGSCDRLVWMKDRGRDGRVLIGSARDAHVRVPSARSEVEIYAERDGRLFAHCDDDWSIDGRAVRGRHPVPPSGVVRADGIEFVVLPWARP